MELSGAIGLLMCYRQICRVLLSVFVVICMSGYAFDFGGDPSLVEASVLW